MLSETPRPRGRTSALTNGDGLRLDGRTVYVVRNEQGLIVPVNLSGDYVSGEVGQPFTDPSFVFPTTIAKTDGRLLVVKSQFDKQEESRSYSSPSPASKFPERSSLWAASLWGTIQDYSEDLEDAVYISVRSSAIRVTSIALST
jgi:hypothetical protein